MLIEHVLVLCTVTIRNVLVYFEFCDVRERKKGVNCNREVAILAGGRLCDGYHKAHLLIN